MIYFTRYVRNKSIKILRLHYDEEEGYIEEHEGRKYFMIDDYMLGKVLDKTKETIGIEQFDGTKILIDIDDKLHDDLTFKNVMIVMIYIIKYDGKFYRQIFNQYFKTEIEPIFADKN